MTLFDTGKRARTPSYENALARDSDDKHVTVSASTEVLEDYGWSKVWEIASDKYDHGDYDKSHEQPVVIVMTSDFG